LLQASTSSTGFVKLFEAGNSASTNLVLGTTDSASGAFVGVNAFGKYSGLNATSALDGNLNFWDITRPGSTSSGTQTIRTQYFESDAITPAYFNLTSGGVLSYLVTTPVPEADTSAMMLAGIGLMGFIARRRKNS